MRLESQLAFPYGFSENQSMLPKYVVTTLVALNIFIFGALMVAAFSPIYNLWEYTNAQPKLCTQLLEGKTVFAFCPSEAVNASAQI
ncbi:MAG: hypothetical protein PHO48_04915 [Candidatus Gracilibacteria bacterium]|nr:hypothetical protein [Candidatus Gracilibacteria bacterium]MDD5179401.1 hypothetical protein [Candidatus Gracilibacteria bacterium]